jgi:hypothetical protein
MPFLSSLGKFSISCKRFNILGSFTPLAPQYPHNSPYVFAENRVIDGIELEGAEYLDKDIAKIQMVMGYAVLRLEGFGTAFNELWGQTNDKELYTDVIFTPNSIYTDPRLYGDRVVHGEPIISSKYNMEVVRSLRAAEIANGGSKANLSHMQYTGRYRKDGKPWKNMARNSANYEKSGGNVTLTAPPTSKVGFGLIAVVNLTNYVVTTSNNFAISNETGEFYKQARGSLEYNWSGDIINETPSAFSQAFATISKASNAGIIDKNFNMNEMSMLFNIVLYGGDGDEPQKIKNLGIKIMKDAGIYRKPEYVVSIPEDRNDNDDGGSEYGLLDLVKGYINSIFTPAEDND